MNVALYDEYNAFKLSYFCYNLGNEVCAPLSAQLPIYGLMEDQISPGIVEGPATYLHKDVPIQGEDPPYFNHFRDSIIPGTKKNYDRLRGHIHDAAIRIKKGVGHRPGVNLPWHWPIKDSVNEDFMHRIDELELPPGAKYFHEIPSVKNGSYGESKANSPTLYHWMERDESGPTHGWNTFKQTAFPDEASTFSTPKIWLNPVYYCGHNSTEPMQTGLQGARRTTPGRARTCVEFQVTLLELMGSQSTWTLGRRRRECCGLSML